MPSLTTKVIAVLSEIDFARKYYALYEQLSNNSPQHRWSKEEIQSVLSQTSLTFKYVSSERLFTHRDLSGVTRMDLGVRVPDTEAELLLEVGQGDEIAGGPFQLLAKQVAEQQHKGFTYDPPYPWLPVSTEDDLRVAVEFAIDTLNEFRRKFSND